MSLYYVLLMRAQMGDKQAADDIYLKFRPAIKNLSRGLHYEYAESDLNIVFAELISTMDLQKFCNASNEQIASYIHKYLNNRSFNLFKQHAKYNPAMVDYDSLHDLITDQNIPNIESKIFIATLLNYLTPQQQEAISKKIIHRFSTTEIAQELTGITEQAIGGRIRRGLRKLRKLWKILDGGG